MATPSYSIATTPTSPGGSECSTSRGRRAKEENDVGSQSHESQAEGHAQNNGNCEGTAADREFSSELGVHFSDESIIVRKDLVNYLTDFGSGAYDTVIYCLDGSPPIPVHGRVLSVFCPYFFELFTSQRSFAYGLAKCYLLDMEGLICCKIVHYLYYGHIHICSSTVFSLIRVGRQLSLLQLVQKCEEFFLGCVKKENCHFLLMHAKLNGNHCMESLIKTFMRTHSIEDSPLPTYSGTNQNLKDFTYEQIIQFLTFRPAPIHDEDEKWVFSKVLEWVRLDAMNRSKYLKNLVATIDLSRLPTNYRMVQFHMNPLLIADRECQEMYMRSVESIVQRMDENGLENYTYEHMELQGVPPPGNYINMFSEMNSGEELDVVNLNYGDEVLSAYQSDGQLSITNSASVHNHNTRKRFLYSDPPRISEHKARRAEEEERCANDAIAFEVAMLQSSVETEIKAVAGKSADTPKQKIKKPKGKPRKRRTAAAPVSTLATIEQFEVFTDVPALPLMVFSTGTKARRNLFYTYNFQSQQCQVLTETLSRRYQSSFTMQGNMILDIGGHSPQGSSTKIELFDTTGVIAPGTPSHYGWRTGPHMKIPRTDFALVSHNECIYAIGGVNILISPVPLNYVEKLEVSVDGRKQSRWQPMASMLEGRRSFGAAVLHQHIFVVGGTGENLEDLATASKYDIEDNSWTDVAPMSEGRRNVRVAVLCRRLYAVGGCRGEQSIPVNTTEVYDSETDQWTYLAPLTIPRNILAVVSHGGRIYAFGGNKERFSAERYNPLSDSWELFKIPDAMRSVNFHCVALYHQL